MQKTTLSHATRAYRIAFPEACGCSDIESRTAESNSALLLGSTGASAPTVEAPDLLLARRVARGEEAAANELATRLYGFILKIVRSHLPRRTAEEDLLQEIYAKIFRNIEQFSAKVPLEHWVSRIAVNTCLNRLKHEWVRPEMRMADLSEEEEAVIQHLSFSEQDIPNDQYSSAAELLDKLMHCLNQDERLVVTLLHLQERTTDEISKMTGWSISLVKVKAFRARNKMRQALETLGLRDEWQ